MPDVYSCKIQKFSLTLTRQHTASLLQRPAREIIFFCCVTPQNTLFVHFCHVKADNTPSDLCALAVLHFDRIPWWGTLLISLCTGAVTMLAVQLWLVPFMKRRIEGAWFGHL
jgi:hypothetical protein